MRSHDSHEIPIAFLQAVNVPSLLYLCAKNIGNTMKTKEKPEGGAQGVGTFIVMKQEDVERFGISIAERVIKMMESSRKEEAKDETITSSELMKRYHVSNVTLWRWKKSGILVPVKIGSKNLYKMSDVKKLLKQ